MPRLGMWASKMERNYSPYSTAMTARRSPRIPVNRRQFSQTTSSRLPRKGNEDKNSIDTEANEYSKSGTDDQAARQEDAAFDPSKTSPEEQKDKAGEGVEGNPLEVSPANPEVSKQRPQQEGGAEKAPDKGASAGKTGAGSPNKGKKVGE